jgi:hypothetical protein
VLGERDEEKGEENADQIEDQEERIASEEAKELEEDGTDYDGVPAVPSLAALLVCCDTADVLYC